jgi:hypothetical protein
MVGALARGRDGPGGDDARRRYPTVPGLSRPRRRGSIVARRPHDQEPVVRLAGVTLSQFVKTGIIAVLFIVLFKFLALKSNLPGLQAVAGAV